MNFHFAVNLLYIYLKEDVNICVLTRHTDSVCTFEPTRIYSIYIVLIFKHSACPEKEGVFVGGLCDAVCLDICASK